MYYFVILEINSFNNRILPKRWALPNLTLKAVEYSKSVAI